MHRSNPGVAYQGVPKAYSEAAAGKAYPDCQATPCDQFEVTFQEVELWIAHDDSSLSAFVTSLFEGS
ncbi:hypothetical protein F2Q70_00030484 [Brassica cretica]|uniref:Prephenate dehydratase domain-containing protein n=1 Tax=Brassica cretica TaxID=69181 RepID=A0A8S9FCP4_BRACR|nr:hypothetical protein F2Q70_00030484 [Brassica cretica]